MTEAPPPADWGATPCTACMEQKCKSSIDAAAAEGGGCAVAVPAYVKCLQDTGAILDCDKQYKGQCAAVRKISECAAGDGASCAALIFGGPCNWVFN